MKGKITGRFIINYWKFILFIVLVLLISALLLHLTYQGIKRETIDHLNARQMIHAKQAAKGIEDFFNDKIALLQQLAKNGHIIDLDATGKQVMRDIYFSLANTISAVTRIDSQGRHLHVEPYEPAMIGKTIVPNVAFREARRTGQVSVSDVFIDLKGLNKIIVHVPVFKDGVFNGTITMLLPFDLIAKRYVEDIRLGRDGYAWIISRDGIELSCPVPGHVGNSVLDNCRNFPDILAMAQRMMRGEQGVTTYMFDRIRGDTVHKTTKHAVFMPIRLANNLWSIVVATPDDEVMAALYSFQNRFFLITLMLTVAIGGFFYILFRNRILTAEIIRRQTVEGELRAKTKELDRYFTHSLDLLCIADTDGYFRRLNPEWEKTLGYPPSELEGQRFLDFVHPDDLEPTIKAVAELTNNREVLNFVNRYRCRDGSYRWIEWRSYPVENMIYAVARDITRRKNIEEALRESESNLKSIFLAAPIGIGAISKSRIIKQANDRLCEMLGYSREELIDRNARMLYATDQDFEFVGRERYSRISPWGAGMVETHWVRKDGTMMDILLSSTPLDLPGLEEGVTFTALDITERKKMEGALRHSEKRYRELFEHAVEGIYQSTPEGRFISVNPSMARLCGYESPAEMTAAISDISVQYYWTPPDREVFKNLLDVNGRTDGFEYRVRRKDGSMIWVSVSARVVRSDSGETLYYEGRCQDITMRKQAEDGRRKLEEQLQQARRMEAVGTLAGGIAHDFNNLLMGIQGYASLMLMDLDKGHPHYEKLQAIEEQVRSGADLTRQLLGFARGGRYEVKPTDLNDLINKAATMFGRTRKEIRIHEKYCEGVWSVEVDRGQMDQVLLNLFVNAWQAMPGGGGLFLQTENVNLEKDYVAPFEIKPGPYVKISVTDTGVGMDEKTRQRIFDPFFTTKEMGRGAGLGLASAYGIIKGHNGFINVYSEKGHGTTFNIYLPASNREVVEDKPSAGTIRTGHETILVVDDERMILDVTQGMLERLGYRVLLAQSGVEAMKIYEEDHGKIDLVILDMIMPGMGGGELLDNMKVVNTEVKVILSSGYSINGEAKAIMARGARLFLQKPFRLDDLSQKIRAALEK